MITMPTEEDLAQAAAQRVDDLFLHAQLLREHLHLAIDLSRLLRQQAIGQAATLSQPNQRSEAERAVPLPDLVTHYDRLSRAMRRNMLLAQRINDTLAEPPPSRQPAAEPPPTTPRAATPRSSSPRDTELRLDRVEETDPEERLEPVTGERDPVRQPDNEALYLAVCQDLGLVPPPTAPGQPPSFADIRALVHGALGDAAPRAQPLPTHGPPAR